MLTFFIALVIGIVMGAIATVGFLVLYGGKALEQHEEAERRRRMPKTEKEADAIVKKAGPVPSDPEVGPFIGDKEGEEEHKKLRDEKIAKEMRRGREEHFRHLLTLTKSEDANAVLYYIAVNDPEAYLSNRSIAKILGWGTPRVAVAIRYLMRNDYIRINDTKGNRGTQYRLLPSKTEKRSA